MRLLFPVLLWFTLEFNNNKHSSKHNSSQRPIAIISKELQEIQINPSHALPHCIPKNPKLQFLTPHTNQTPGRCGGTLVVEKKKEMKMVDDGSESAVSSVTAVSEEEELDHHLLAAPNSDVAFLKEKPVRLAKEFL
ncbi:unnamed protein product [Ilex paraguariensis]|uniref:Uncharacterized protein n=1 Tax=Ilex paraguariensis TaxID=185542 RepID=A0ABC8TUX3_9AQUA